MGWSARAVQRGAVAIVAERAPDSPIGAATFVKTKDVRLALAQAAARLYPRQPETIVQVTGTSGKTSVTDFVRQIWTALGAKAASLGTLSVVAPSGPVAGSLTTPNPVSLHKTLDGLARGGVAHLALEASSHGILQRRLDGVRLTAAAFTNLSRDHLDYHATLEDYLAAKLELFERLLEPGQAAIVDADSDVAEKVIAACERRGLCILSTGFKGASLRLLEAKAENFSTRMRVPMRQDCLAPSSSRRGPFGIERACCRGSLHCGGKPGRGGLAGARKARRCAWPSPTGRPEKWCAGPCRLCA